MELTVIVLSAPIQITAALFPLGMIRGISERTLGAHCRSPLLRGPAPHHLPMGDALRRTPSRARPLGRIRDADKLTFQHSVSKHISTGSLPNHGGQQEDI